MIRAKEARLRYLRSLLCPFSFPSQTFPVAVARTGNARPKLAVCVYETLLAERRTIFQPAIVLYVEAPHVEMLGEQ